MSRTLQSVAIFPCQVFRSDSNCSFPIKTMSKFFYLTIVIFVFEIASLGTLYTSIGTRMKKLWPFDEGCDLCATLYYHNGHNFFIRVPIEAYKVPTRSYFKDEDNGGKIKGFGHHLDRQRTVSIRPYSTCTSIN